jgi:hypothetical protein
VIGVFDPLDWTWGGDGPVGQTVQVPRASRYRHRYTAADAHGASSAVASGVAALPLLYEADFTNTGAFQVATNSGNGSRFGYGDRVCTYDPVNDQLILSGHRTETYVDASGASSGQSMKFGKCSIAASKFSALNTATKTQNFYDPTNGDWIIALTAVPEGTVVTNKMWGGCGIFDDDILCTVTSWYDAGGDGTLRSGLPAIWRRPLDLSDSTNVLGPFILSDTVLNSAWWDGWIVPIPDVWRSSFGGNKCLAGNGSMSIVSRQSYGVSLYAFDPDDMLTAASGSVIDATRVLGYPSTNPMNGNAASPTGSQSAIWNGTTDICGAIWPAGTRSILFFGSHGHGPIVYSGSFQSDDFRLQIWAYDALELAEVYAGTRDAWDVQPYAIWNPTDLYQANLQADADGPTAGLCSPRGVGYKESNKTVFLRYMQNPAANEHNAIVTWTLDF